MSSSDVQNMRIVLQQPQTRHQPCQGRSQTHADAGGKPKTQQEFWVLLLGTMKLSNGFCLPKRWAIQVGSQHWGTQHGLSWGSSPALCSVQGWHRDPQAGASHKGQGWPPLPGPKPLPGGCCLVKPGELKWVKKSSTR